MDSSALLLLCTEHIRSSPWKKAQGSWVWLGNRWHSLVSHRGGKRLLNLANSRNPCLVSILHGMQTSHMWDQPSQVARWILGVALQSIFLSDRLADFFDIALPITSTLMVR